MSVIPGTSLSLDDVGARVSVRRRLSGSIGNPVGDVVGDLQSLDADGLAIRLADGSVVAVARSALVAARVVGPSMRSARELEAVSGRSWPAPDEEWLGQWWLRAAGGFTMRSDAVRPLGDPGRSLDEALAFTAAWYADRDLPVRLRVVRRSSLDAELTRRGWDSLYETSVQTATVVSIRRSGPQPAPADCTLTAEPPASWLRRYRGGVLSPTAYAVLTGAPHIAFATIGTGDTATAIGRAAVEAPWVGFAAVEVDPDARRQGHARAIMSALAGWAADRGAVRAWLEVLADNDPALRLYAALGFAEHHRYSYRTPPSG